MKYINRQSCARLRLSLFTAPGLVLVRGLMLALLLAAQPAWAQLQFAAGWDEGWQCRNRDGECRLILALGEFGEARFVSAAASGVTFELQARKDLFAGGDIQVSRYAPPWLTHSTLAGPARISNASHIRGGGAIVRGAAAQDMLWALRQGHHLRLTAAAAHAADRQVVVEIKAAGLPAVIDQFLACAHTRVSVSWQQVSRTRITYPLDGHELSAAAKAQLAPVVAYVQQDPGVHTLYIDGHTDASGGRQHNYRLSKKRAETVAAYLKAQGLQKLKFVVRFHGAAYPVARADAANRRTTVRLQRGSDELSGAVAGAGD